MAAQLDAIDCQGFAGGFTMGTVKAGFRLVGKREYPAGFGMASCEANRHLLGDVWQGQASDPAEWQPYAVPYVFGNPPCSGFSLLSSREFRGEDSKINSCMWAFADFVSACRPEVAVFESVQQAYKQGSNLMRALRERVETSTGERYALHHVLHNAASVGGCAIRKRYFWVVAKVPFGIEPPKVHRIPTVRQTIGDLVGLANTWEKQPYRRPASWWARKLRTSSGLVDGHHVRINPLIRRAQDLMERVEWPANKTISEIARQYYQTYGELPESWNATKDKMIANDFKMGFYQMHRWAWNANVRVITGGAGQLLLHPEESRTLTNREQARIQGFPDDWRIRPLKFASGDPQILWGKGIPVHCGEWISGWAREAILGSPGGYSGELIGDREYLIDVTNDYKSATLG